MFNDEHQQQALLTILYSLEPQEVGDPFIQIRRWETFSGDCCELIVETGFIDENGDLQSKCQVLPFHMNVDEALHTIAR